jgi:hypothetical protein
MFAEAEIMNTQTREVIAGGCAKTSGKGINYFETHTQWCHDAWGAPHNVLP